jgi:hypothetical protein
VQGCLKWYGVWERWKEKRYRMKGVKRQRKSKRQKQRKRKMKRKR